MKILAVNQVTSVLFRSVLDALVEAGGEVCLVTGYLEADEGYTPRFEVIQACPLRKAPAWRRVMTWLGFTCAALRAMARHRSHLALVVSNPPLVPWVAPLARRLFGVRYVELIYDVYPESMECLGMIRRNGCMARFLRGFSRRAHLQADAIITISECIRRTLERQAGAEGRRLAISVIPNWADIDRMRPLAKADNPFARQHELTDKFVVMYSGAFGASHDIATIVAAAEAVQDLPDVRFVLIGGGTREQEVRELVRQKALPNLLLLPWQPVDQVRFSLACADCQVVSIDVGFEGISVPSKTFTALAVGAAILGMTPDGTQLEQIIADHECGFRIAPRSSEELSSAVRRLYSDRALLERMRSNARRAAETAFNARVCTQEYVELLKSLTDDSFVDGTSAS